jgi:hypothetical protein
MMVTPSNSRASLAVLAALLALTATVYWQALAGPFLLDDFGSVVPLASAQSAGMSWWDLLTQAPPAIRARWLSNLSFLATHALSGAPAPSAFAFKLGNLVVHLACGLAAWVLSRRLALLAGTDAVRARWMATLVAGLFLLHPLLASTVLYPVQRMAQLATLFLLLAANAYAAWRSDYATRTPRGHLLGVAAILGFALLAFFSKESGALAPLLILAIELSLFRWPAGDAPHRSRFDTGFGLACAAPLVLGVVAMAVRWSTTTAGYARREFTLGERLLTEAHVLADYLGQIFVPRLAGMGLFRDDFPIQHGLDAGTGLLLLAYAAAIAGAIALRRRWPLLALGILWFFAAHALESTFIALELVFEHRNYLALFGPALAVAAGVARIPRAPVALALGALLLAVLATLTWQRAHEWRNHESWLASEVAHHPASLRAGTEAVLDHYTRGRIPEAVAERERLQAALPELAQPVMLKLAFACRGIIPIELFTAAELQLLRTARIAPDALNVYAALVDRVPRQCEATDWGAFSSASAALAENRGSASTRRTRAGWWRFAAQARLRLGDWQGVRVAVERVVKEENNDPRDWLMLAEAAARTGDKPAYFGARQQLLGLLGGVPGPLAGALAKVDAIAAQIPSEPASR